MYKLFYSDQVVNKDIPQLSSSTKAIIKATIEKKLLQDPIKFGKPLRYSLKNCRSLRIGDDGVIYQVVDIQVNILIIQHRKNCYNAYTF